MFLEEWIHNKIKRELKEDSECRQCLGEDDLKDITRQEVEAFQLFKLRKILNYAGQRSAFYRDMFRNHRVDPGEVCSLADLAKIPFTRSTDLAQTPYKFLCVPLGEVARVFTHTTSGTTGPAKKVFFSDADVGVITDCMAAIMGTALDCAGLAASGCVVQIFLPDGAPMSQANLVAKGVQKMGGLPLIGDISASTEDQSKAIARARPTMLMGSAFRIYRLTQEARKSRNFRTQDIRSSPDLAG